MAEVSLPVGGYTYQIACRDGEEAHLERLGALVDTKAGEARAAVGNVSEVRQLLLAALLLADENASAPAAAASPTADGSHDVFDALAQRIEEIADRVEKLAL